MDNLNTLFIDKIVESCFDFYSKTPKSGKPIENEWTVLSCVVKFTENEEIEVVSLGTGSKCVGATKMSPKGDVLNDSHAEVIARRGFILYLYDNINKCLENQTSLFNFIENKFQLKSGYQFAFYSSQLPCGDASIFPKSDEDLVGDVLQSRKHKIEDTESPTKKPNQENDIHRTGAKCLPNSEQDLKESGSKYHSLGQVRTKPGRGDRTLSVSCSDKMARWIYCGIQGGLLTLLCEPIYIKHFIFGAGVPYSEEALQRALLHRGSSDLKLKFIPKFYKSSFAFENRRIDISVRPAAGSIVAVKMNTFVSEVAVQGKKLGLTKKKASLPDNSLCISKYNLYKRFIQILNKNEAIRTEIIKNNQLNSIPYNVMKQKAESYVECFREVKENLFKIWTTKPDMWDFCIDCQQL